MTSLLGVLRFGLLTTGACLDVKADSFEDLFHAGAFQGMDGWTKIFESFGQGERMNPEQLSKLAKVPTDFGVTSKAKLDPSFGLQLGQEKIQERIHQLKDKPDELMKIVNQPLGLFFFCSFWHVFAELRYDMI